MPTRRRGEEHSGGLGAQHHQILRRHHAGEEVRVGWYGSVEHANGARVHGAEVQGEVGDLFPIDARLLGVEATAQEPAGGGEGLGDEVILGDVQQREVVLKWLERKRDDVGAVGGAVAQRVEQCGVDPVVRVGVKVGEADLATLEEQKLLFLHLLHLVEYIQHLHADAQWHIRLLERQHAVRVEHAATHHHRRVCRCVVRGQHLLRVRAPTLRHGHRQLHLVPNARRLQWQQVHLALRAQRAVLAQRDGPRAPGLQAQRQLLVGGAVADGGGAHRQRHGGVPAHVEEEQRHGPAGGAQTPFRAGVLGRDHQRRGPQKRFEGVFRGQQCADGVGLGGVQVVHRQRRVLRRQAPAQLRAAELRVVALDAALLLRLQQQLSRRPVLAVGEAHVQQQRQALARHVALEHHGRAQLEAEPAREEVAHSALLHLPREPPALDRHHHRDARRERRNGHGGGAALDVLRQRRGEGGGDVGELPRARVRDEDTPVLDQREEERVTLVRRALVPYGAPLSVRVAVSRHRPEEALGTRRHAIRVRRHRRECHVVQRLLGTRDAHAVAHHLAPLSEAVTAPRHRSARPAGARAVHVPVAVRRGPLALRRATAPSRLHRAPLALLITAPTQRLATAVGAGHVLHLPCTMLRPQHAVSNFRRTADGQAAAGHVLPGAARGAPVGERAVLRVDAGLLQQHALVRLRPVDPARVHHRRALARGGLRCLQRAVDTVCY